MRRLNVYVPDEADLNRQLQQRFGALLIAVYTLPVRERQRVMQRYELNYLNMMEPEAEHPDMRFFATSGEQLKPEPFVEFQDTPEYEHYVLGKFPEKPFVLGD